MKIEKLRNNHKKEVIIGTILTVVIGGALTFRLTHSKYRVTQSIDLGTGVINYKVPDFKIMAMYKSEDGTNYSEITDRMPSTGYVINEDKSYCTSDNVNHDNEAKLYTNENGEHVFENLKKYDKCYLYFDKGADSVTNVILANITLNSETPDFSMTATTNEGVYSTSDGMYGGYSYYWRGAVNNNYVTFAGFCWRIIRINGDKTIRLIYDGSTCHANGTSTASSIAVKQAYNTSYGDPYLVGWTYQAAFQRPVNAASGTNSYAKTQIENWYNNNLKSYESKIADGKFCNDRDVQIGHSWSSPSVSFGYAARGRIYLDYQPTFSCTNSGDIYTLKVGLITADEVAFAGGLGANSQYYLYNGHDYWTMSPYEWGTDGPAMVFNVTETGSISHDKYLADTSVGLRPVINLKSDVTFSSGDGTISSPYIVS